MASTCTEVVLEQPRGGPLENTASLLVEEILAKFKWFNTQVSDFLPRSSVLPGVKRPRKLKKRGRKTVHPSFRLRTMKACMYEHAYDFCLGAFSELTSSDKSAGRKKAHFTIMICLFQLYQQSLIQKVEIGYWYNDLYRELSKLSNPAVSTNVWTAEKFFMSPSSEDLVKGFDMLVAHLVSYIGDTGRIDSNQVQEILNYVRGKVVQRYSTLNPTRAEIGFYILCVYCCKVEEETKGKINLTDNLFTCNLENTIHECEGKPFSTRSCFVPIWTRQLSSRCKRPFSLEASGVPIASVYSVNCRGGTKGIIIVFDSTVNGLNTAVASTFMYRVTAFMSRANMLNIPLPQEKIGEVMYTEQMVYMDDPALFVMTRGDSTVLSTDQTCLSVGDNFRHAIFSAFDSMWHTALQITHGNIKIPDPSAVSITLAHGGGKAWPVYVPLTFIRGIEPAGNPDPVPANSACLKRSISETDQDFCDNTSRKSPKNQETEPCSNLCENVQVTIEADPTSLLFMEEEVEREAEESERGSGETDVESYGKNFHCLEERAIAILLQTWYDEQRKANPRPEGQPAKDERLCGLELSVIRTMLQENAEKSYTLHNRLVHNITENPLLKELENVVKSDMKLASDILDRICFSPELNVILPSLAENARKL